MMLAAGGVLLDGQAVRWPSPPALTAMTFSATAWAWLASRPPSNVRPGMPQIPRKAIVRTCPGRRTPEVPRLMRESTTRHGGSGLKTASGGWARAAALARAARAARASGRKAAGAAETRGMEEL